MGFARTVDATTSHQGQFLDLRALVFALTDRSHSLASAGEAFGLDRPKLAAPPHGVITTDYIAYARRDVEATVELFEKVSAEYGLHPIDRQMTKVFSPASIGKAYLRAMGVAPLLERLPDFPRDVLGVGMLSYFGGRAECRVRRLAVPVRYLDFRAMYSTVNALMGLWQLLIAEHIEVVDATDEVRALLADVSPARVLDPALWPSLVGFVQLRPDGDILPVRAPYDTTPGVQIGVNHLAADEPLWFTLPDAVQTTLLRGTAPDVVRAFRLTPSGQQAGLRPVTLRGAVRIDPTTDDFFRKVVEERARLEPAVRPGDLETIRQPSFLKVLASATSYGIFAEMNPEARSGSRTTVRVEGLDGPFTVPVDRPEMAGEFYFGPMASVITGAARLMLALLERFVTDAGGTWAMADTDSMAIVASRDGTPITGLDARVLTWVEVEALRQRFAALNPYDPTLVPGSILKLEAVNLMEGVEQELWCFAISAKRYALYSLDEHGKPLLVKWSEHGLGHLLNPTDPEDDDRGWIRQVWEGLVREALGLPVDAPAWLDRPAIGSMTMSSPELLRRFAGHNEGKTYADQVKPFNFHITTHVRPFVHPAGIDRAKFQLIAPYTLDPRQWGKLAWLDYHSVHTFRISTSGDAGEAGIARIKTFRDVIAEYRVHPEAKSAGLDGEPCGRATVGLLGRRHVVAGRIRYIGKESNRVDDVDAGLVHDPTEVSTEYVDPRRGLWILDILPRLQAAQTIAIASELGVNVSSVKRWKSGAMTPHRKMQERVARLLEVRDERIRST